MTRIGRSSSTRASASARRGRRLRSPAGPDRPDEAPSGAAPTLGSVPLVARVPLLCLVSAAAVAAAGGGDAFWLCVPLALVVARPAEDGRLGAGGPVLVRLAAGAPAPPS